MEMFIREMGYLGLERDTGEVYLTKLIPGTETWDPEFELDTENLIKSVEAANEHQKLIESE